MTERLLLRAGIKARHGAGVTSRSGRINHDDDGIRIAVERKTHDHLRVARRFAFVPELVSRSRPEPRLFGFECSRETLSIHVGEREHFSGRSILHDSRNQPTVVETNLVEINHLTSSPRLLR